MSQTQANEDEANRDCSTSDNMSDETHDLINKILDKVTKLRQGLKQDFEKEVDLVNDEMEQLEQQMKEIKKNKTDFESSIADPSNASEAGNQFIRYQQNYINQLEKHIAKLKLQNKGMRDQWKRTSQNLKQKEGAGKTVLNLQQLQIENAQGMVKLEGIWQNLLQCKCQTAECKVLLHQTQESVFQATLERESLLDKISNSKQQIKQAESQLINAEIELEAAKSKHEEQTSLTGSYEVPTIYSYVDQHAKMQVLRRVLGEWSRKVKILEQENAILTKKCSRLGKDPTLHRKAS